MLYAQCQSIEWEPGDSFLAQGKFNDVAHYALQGYYVRCRGFGWWTIYKSSKLIVHATLDNEAIDLWVDKPFRDKLGKLTSNRRQCVMNTMPNTIEVVQREKKNGDVYYVASDNAISQWIVAAEKALHP